MQVLENTEIEDGRQDGKEENLQEVNDVVTTITAKHHSDSDTHIQSQHFHTLTRDGHKCGTPRRLALASLVSQTQFTMLQVTRYVPHAESLTSSSIWCKALGHGIFQNFTDRWIQHSVKSERHSKAIHNTRLNPQSQ